MSFIKVTENLEVEDSGVESSDERVNYKEFYNPCNIITKHVLGCGKATKTPSDMLARRITIKHQHPISRY